MPSTEFLPSPYLPHPGGLMHLPRMVEKVRRHWAGELSDDYARTLGRGFDDLLCQHLGVPFEAFLQALEGKQGAAEIDEAVRDLLPEDPRVHVWNRKLVQRGLNGYSLERLNLRKQELGLEHRDDILTMCDLLEVHEGRLP